VDTTTRPAQRAATDKGSNISKNDDAKKRQIIHTLPKFHNFLKIATSRATSPTAASEEKPLNNYHLSFVNYHLKKLHAVPEKGTITTYLYPR